MVKEAKNMNVDESEKKEKKERKRREKQKDGDSLESDSGKKSTDFEENSSGSVVNEGHKKRKRKERVVESEEKSSVDGTSEGEKRKKRKKEKDVDGVELLVEDVVDRVDEKVVDGTSRSEKKKRKKSKREERKDREFEMIDGNGEGGENEEASSLGKNKPSGSHDKGTVNAASGSEQKKSNKEKKDGDILKLVLENLTDSIDEKDSSSGKKEPSRSHDKGSGSKKMKGNEKEEEEEKKKKKKKKKKKDGDNSKSLLENAVGSLKKKHAVSQEKGVVNDASGSEKKRKKKDSQDGNRLPKKTKTTNADDLGAKTSSSSKKKSNRVTFKGDVEEFPPLEDDDVSKYDENNLIRGKRFSPEEDQLIRDSVYKYIEVNQLGEEGLQKVLKSGHYPDVRGCWKEIAAALPWRPYEAVYCRGTTILMMSEKRGFTEEENDIIRKFHAEYGPQWHKLAPILGKHRMHIKDAWRRIRLPNVKKGNWSQDEYQGLFDLVNLNLRIKAFDQRKTKNVMIRENISWEAISDKLTTRTMSTLCHKWYDHLASPMVKKKLWADSDDYRLIAALQEQDACNADDVEWDSLLETRGRPGEICRKRWNEMVRCIGGHRERIFLEQIDVLAKRYCGDMLQYREEKNEPEEDS